MLTSFQRLILAVLLAAALFSVTAVVEAAPQACCAAASRADGSCHDETGGEESLGICLTCLLGQGLKFEPAAQAAYPVALSERAGGSTAEKPLDLAFAILRPPISG